MKIFDLGIIGLGPGGHKAALLALKAGLKTVAFEKACVGGTCLNLGCIPTKALLHSSEVFAELKNLTKSGLGSLDKPVKEALCGVSFNEIFERKNAIVQKFANAIKKDLLTNGLTLVEFEASARVLNQNERKMYEGCKFALKANNEEYFTRKLIIATGSAPFELPGLKFDHKNILSSDDVLNLAEIPENIGIVGSGAIGTEWARIFSNLGARVAVFEKAPNLLPAADFDVSKRLLRMFKMAKIQAYTGVEVENFNGKEVLLSDGKKVECTKILVAVGRKRVMPKIEFPDKDFKLALNPDGTSNCDDLYVLGDVCAKKMLAHTATAQAVRILARINGQNPPSLCDTDIPTVVYGEPEIASIGLREQDLPPDYKENPEYKIYNLQVAYLAKAWCDNKTDGFIKLIARNNKLLGAHIISKEASSLITQVQIAMAAGMDVNALRDVVFAHPTYSEGIAEAINNG